MERCDYNTMVMRIKAQMEKIGINARELADKASVGKSFVYDILSGKSTNPTSIKLMSIAKVLGVPLSYLISNENNFYEGNNVIPISPVYHLEIMDKEDKAAKAALYLPIDNKLPFNVKNLRIFSTKGDSMSPTLEDQDLLLVNIEDKTPHPAGLFVIRDTVGISIKRLEYLVDSDKSVRLHVISDNKKYSSYECNISSLQVLGRVIWYARVV